MPPTIEELETEVQAIERDRSDLSTRKQTVVRDVESILREDMETILNFISNRLLEDSKLELLLRPGANATFQIQLPAGVIQNDQRFLDLIQKFKRLKEIGGLEDSQIPLRKVDA